ncbi:hypothetical protein OAO35_03835 [Euryarchaeota archaeon]|jgi:hypothetical protein|nr:hypothetical protein [Euryarchaeota archaeon]
MPEPIKRVTEALWNSTLYTLSLPERYLRGLTALLGGMLHETTEILIPDFVKDTTTYNIFVTNVLRFTVENIGEVEGIYIDEGLDGDYASRKLLGNAIEGIGLATVHVSPLWIFAFFADSVKGGKIYLKRLRAELIEKGYIDSKNESDSIHDLLEGIERTTTSFAQNIDVPPLSRDEIRDNLREIQDSIGSLFSKTGEVAGDVKEEVSILIQDFLETASEEDQTLMELSGVMTLQVTKRAKKAIAIATTAPQVAGKILYENILGYYGDTLSDIHKRGYAVVASDTIEPYGSAIIKQFSPEKETWTEKLFRSSSHGLKRIFGMQTSK